MSKHGVLAVEREIMVMQQPVTNKTQKVIWFNCSKSKVYTRILVQTVYISWLGRTVYKKHGWGIK